MKLGAYIVLALPEWRLWLECRELRCLATRIRRIDTRDEVAFGRLLDTAPCLDTGDEAALVIARLPSDFMAVADVSEHFDGGDLLHLPLRLVQGFHAVSARAEALLAIDADTWNCRIEGPLNGAAWDRWCRCEDERRARSGGSIVARFFGLDPPHPDLISASRLADMPRFPALDDSRRSDHENCCSLGWAEAFSHCRLRLGTDDGGLRAELGPVVRLVQDRKRSYALAAESFATEAAIAAANYAEAILESRSVQHLAVIATAALHHFSFYLTAKKDVDGIFMRSFGEALATVRNRYDPELAAILAYEVGRQFPEPKVAALAKDLDRDAYPFLMPAPLPFKAVDLMRVPDGVNLARSRETPMPPAAADSCCARTLKGEAQEPQATAPTPETRASLPTAPSTASPVDAVETETTSVPTTPVADGTVRVARARSEKRNGERKPRAPNQTPAQSESVIATSTVTDGEVPCPPVEPQGLEATDGADRPPPP